MVNSALPKSLVLSIGVGIGLFIAFIGMKDTGLSVVGADATNLVGLGGCPAEYLDPDIPKACMSHGESFLVASLQAPVITR